MDYKIRELRDMTGLSQQKFADKYGIPVSTIRKWEQGEASPAPYVIKLLAGSIPETENYRKIIKGTGAECYYYNRYNNTVSDRLGTTITVNENLDEVKEKNLIIYLEDLFESYYAILERFNRDCRHDKNEDIIWVR